MKNESGQATTAAMILMPIVLLVVTTLVVLGFAFMLEAKATAKCRASLGQSQSEAREALEKLLELNPKAEKLEQLRQAALLNEAIAFASGNSVAAAAAQLALQTIEKLQIPVRAAQLRWLAKGRANSMAAADRAEASIIATLPKVLISQGPNANLTRARFDVIASPPSARTPTYRTAPGFEKSQRAEVRWLLTLPEETNRDGLNPAINIGCAITLTHEGADKWSPQILEDKLLPN